MTVKRIFIFFSFAAIIFLTGCARKGYHTSEFKEIVPGAHGSAFSEVFSQPMKGEIAVSFGAQEDAVPIKGIVIESKSEDSVKAAQDGRVVLVDAHLKGYGRTIIIEHSSEFSTVYARNAQILVSPGQMVHRNDLIARAGKKAGGSFFSIYFELRKNLKAENPVLYFQ